MKIEKRFCDVCNAEEPAKDVHWSYAFGKVTLDFKGVPGIQRDYSQKDICIGCASALEKVIQEKLTILKREGCAGEGK